MYSVAPYCPGYLLTQNGGQAKWPADHENSRKRITECLGRCLNDSLQVKQIVSDTAIKSAVILSSSCATPEGTIYPVHGVSGPWSTNWAVFM